MLIHKDALAVSECGTTQHTRYFLNGAMFDTQGRAIATDGNVLVRFTSDAIDPSSFPADALPDIGVAGDVIVHADDLNIALATMGSRITSNKFLALVPNGETVTMVSVDGHRNVQIRTRKVDGIFPNCDKLFNVDKPLSETIILAPKLLSTIAKIAMQCEVKSLYFSFYGPDTQVLFTGKGENGTLDGAIMPMRK